MEHIALIEDSQTTPRQFDTTAEIVKKMRTEAAGLAEVTIQWPSDDLWIKRAKARKVLTRLLGRGQQEASVEAGESDLDVYKAARVEESPELTAAEATQLINLLAWTRVLSLELGAREATIRLQVMNGVEVTHRLKIPTAQQAKDCTAAMDRFVGLPHNVFSNTVNLQVTSRLWEELLVDVENYSHAVPMIHKDTAMREVFQALDRELAEGSDEKGFSSNGAWPEQPSPRFILSQLLRREQLCPGATVCPEVQMLDPQAERDALPCSECPRVRLDQYLQFSDAGRLLRGALDLDWAAKCGLQIRLSDVSYPEFMRLRLLVEERHTFELEEAERAREKAEQQQQSGRMRHRQHGR